MELTSTKAGSKGDHEQEDTKEQEGDNLRLGGEVSGHKAGYDRRLLAGSSGHVSLVVVLGASMNGVVSSAFVNIGVPFNVLGWTQNNDVWDVVAAVSHVALARLHGVELDGFVLFIELRHCASRVCQDGSVEGVSNC